MVELTAARMNSLPWFWRALLLPCWALATAASAAAFCCSRMLAWMGLKLAPSRLGEEPGRDIAQT